MAFVSVRFNHLLRELVYHVSIMSLFCCACAGLGNRLDEVASQRLELRAGVLCRVLLRTIIIFAAHDQCFNCAKLLSSDLCVDLLICILELAPHKSNAPCFALLDDFMDFLQPFLVFEQLSVIIW